MKPKSKTVRACGGFADKSWKSPNHPTGDFITDPKAFLFRFSDDLHGGARERASIRPGEADQALMHDVKFGPAFGDSELELCSYNGDYEVPQDEAAGDLPEHMAYKKVDGFYEQFADGKTVVGKGPPRWEGDHLFELWEWEVFQVVQ